MTVKFCSFASGSSGNCYVVKDEKTAILIDAGISGRRILEGLERTKTPADMVEGVLVTHEHIDHVRSLGVIAKKIPGLLVYANKGTWDCIDKPVPEERKRAFVTGEDFYIGDFVIRPFAISHDAAEPVGFSIYHGDKQISILTDSGCISEEQFEEVLDADLLVLEANHEEEMLLFGKYPYSLKHRILGDKGHLSNITAGQWLCRIVNERPKDRRVLLGHMSRENNTPEVAMQAIRNTLEENGIYIGGALKVDVVLRDTISKIFNV